MTYEHARDTQSLPTDLLHVDLETLCAACDRHHTAYLYVEAAEAGYDAQASMHHWRIAQAAATEIKRRHARMMRGWTLGAVAMWSREWPARSALAQADLAQIETRYLAYDGGV
jgi:hypothetical protein